MANRPTLPLYGAGKKEPPLRVHPAAAPSPAPPPSGGMAGPAPGAPMGGGQQQAPGGEAEQSLAMDLGNALQSFYRTGGSQQALLQVVDFNEMIKASIEEARGAPIGAPAQGQPAPPPPGM